MNSYSKAISFLVAIVLDVAITLRFIAKTCETLARDFK